MDLEYIFETTVVAIDNTHLMLSTATVLRYGNEAGKGDHQHWFATETIYAFSTPEQLLTDFMADIERWKHDYRDF